MKFTVEKGIPVPNKPGHGLVNDLRVTMKDMKPGESFMVLFNAVRPKTAVNNAYFAVKQELAKQNKPFQSRTVKTGSPPVEALRIWCVEKPK